MIELLKHNRGYQHRQSYLDQFDKTQITVENRSQQSSWIQLWGANKGIQYLPTNDSLTTESYPQAIGINPFNSSIYVVNQLSGSVQVFDNKHQLVKVIELEQEMISTSSPAAIAINELTGEVYVLGLLSDTLYVIGTDLEVSHRITLADRPLKIAYSNENQKLYIQHLSSTAISIVDILNNFSIELFDTGIQIASLVVDSFQGDWLVVSSDGSQIKSFDQLNAAKSTFDFDEHKVKSCLYEAESSNLIAIYNSLAEIQMLNGLDGSILKSESLNAVPNSLKIISGQTTLLEFQNPSVINLLNEEFQIVETFQIDLAPTDYAYNSLSEVFYAIQLLESKIVVYDKGNTPQILYSDNYQEVATDFQHSPTLVKHLKVIYSNQNILPLFRLGYKSSSGKQESSLISLMKYHSPQHYGRVYEVTELKNKIIDGRVSWEVFVPPDIRVSLLIYHK